MVHPFQTNLGSGNKNCNCIFQKSVEQLHLDLHPCLHINFLPHGPLDEGCDEGILDNVQEVFPPCLCFTLNLGPQ